METTDVSRFRQCILDADWDGAEDTLVRLGLTDDDGLWVRGRTSILSAGALTAPQEAKFLISQQKYMELLEGRRTAEALQILRNELAPLSPDPEQLHSLARRVRQIT